MRSIVLSFFLVAIAAAVLHAAQLSEDDHRDGKERKEHVVAAIKKEIGRLDSRRNPAALKEKKAELAAAVKRPIEEYFGDVLRDRKQAEAAQQLLMEQRRRIEAEAAEKKAADLKAEQEDEAERREQSGNCPLKLKMANFSHLGSDQVSTAVHRFFLPTEVPGPKTIVTCEVENKSGQPVEAYEIFIEFLDGFDAAIKEHRFQGTRVADAGFKKTTWGMEPVELAVQMRIYVQRVKTQDGAVWERRPEHNQVGKLVKKTDGAKIGDRP